MSRRLIRSRHAVLALLLLASGTASARPLRGLVYADASGDGRPSMGELGVPGVVVAYDTTQFTVTDAQGAFTLDVPDGARGIAWVRVPDGFRPGPAWAPDTGADAVDIALVPSTAATGPLTFVVAADTHLTAAQPFFADLAHVAADAVALPSPPAFFTILGDITQQNRPAEFDLVEAGTRDLGVPYVPVPGNHDWYDGGAAWRARYGPDSYSFDVGSVHVVVWNMALPEAAITAYLGAELARVPPSMTVVALTHAPPAPAVIGALRALGVDYLLTGHTHANRVVDHGGLVELATEPLLMGGLDATPAGYRVITLEHGRLAAEHHTVVERPLVAVIAPAPGACVPATGAAVLVAAALDAGPARVTAHLDCDGEIALRPAGGWSWQATLPALAPGAHTLRVEARTPGGPRGATTTTFAVCPAPAARTPAPPTPPATWPQLGGGPTHTGAREREFAPPLATRWATAVGGHVLGAPAIADGLVVVTVTDLADGTSGGVVALELATGAVRWRVPTPVPVRGGPALDDGVVLIAQLDGTVLGLDLASGAERWRHELGLGLEARAATLSAPPVIEGGDVLVGGQRRVAALSVRAGAPLWTRDPVGRHQDFASLAALAVEGGLGVGVFDLFQGGVIAFDRVTGALAWHVDSEQIRAVHAAPVIAGGLVYLVSSTTDVIALELTTGEERWRTRLESGGFEWGNAALGAPALAHGVLVVPLMWRDLVGLDAASGRELWRAHARPGPLRTTHYRGAGEAGFAAAPVIAGDIVWAADTSGALCAYELRTGGQLACTALGVPVLAGLALAGDDLVVASYDGSVRALTPVAMAPRPGPALRCEAPPRAGCCGATDHTSPLALAGLVLALVRCRRRR